MSRLPVDSDKFREALDMQWRNVDVCAEEKVDRENPDYARYMAKSTIVGIIKSLLEYRHRTT